MRIDVKMAEKGKLTQNGVHLQDHEYATVKLFLELGYDIELIPRSQVKYYRTPDMVMNGVPWEIKSPQGKGKYTAQNTMQNGASQSRNIIIDLRRCKLPENQAIKEFEREFRKSKHFKRMKIVKNNMEILDFS